MENPKPTHYIELNLTDELHDNKHRAVARAVKALHDAMVQIQKNLPLDFPQWSDPVMDAGGQVLTPGEFGGVVRVFGNAESLWELKGFLKANRLVRNSLLLVSDVLSVPLYTRQRQFRRYQTPDKQSHASKATVERRQARRAAAGKTTFENYKPGALRPRNWLHMSSSADGKATYRVSVVLNESSDLSCKEGSVNSYGLGGWVPSW